ncbi:MAG: hypothetical protein HY077_06710 [Elusimicrobia bacterium]|nr:hypothetical protein [Elusimicrobiota bacterium]
MRHRHHNSFAKCCQRAALALWTLAALASPGSAEHLAAPSPAAVYTNEFLQRLSRMHVRGSLSLNWRNVGPRRPGFETQIQNEIYLADMYFGLEGPFIDGVPLQVEWHMPTAGQGSLQLYQLNFSYNRIEDFTFQFGQFLVPFSRYNELYRANDFLTVTRPLLYASPDSLDLVVRVNSPRPPVSVGYTDLGARATWYPPSKNPYLPSEITFFVVNGLGENNNRQRTFPNTDFLGIPGVPGNGSNIDFGHQNNNLADNNNYKSFGGRAVFSLGDVRFPWPVPEGILDVTGMNLGLAGMGGQYDLEGHLNYQTYAADLTFDYRGFNVSAEYVYGFNQFLSPLENFGAIALPVSMVKDFETNQGYFIQTSFPLIRKPPWGERVTGVLVFNQMFRRGPLLDLFLNQVISGTTFPSIQAEGAGAYRGSTHINKFTAALNYQLTDHFNFKTEYSYWTMGDASTRSLTSIGLVDIYQIAFAMAMGF